MPDENQILLKVPRQYNMYSFDMKTPALIKDYACLIAKATSDESKLWHRRIYNFSKSIFDGMVSNLKSKTKFLMYPQFLQMISEIQTENKHPYLAIVLTKKIFRNIKRGFRGVPRPLLLAMLPVVDVDQSAGQADQVVDQPLPSEPLPSSSHPLVLSATTESEPTPETKVPQSQDPTHPHVAEERTMTVDDLLQLVPKLITKVNNLEIELK
ncbi:hypothetical protein Tco_0036419, partial [Tanacetum coccineum]